ncbi:MAG TPA: YdcH family protein [Candidatus Binatia bacterium]|nr:YdcH family protein [Candidatus Binatia bacterium]
MKRRAISGCVSADNIGTAAHLPNNRLNPPTPRPDWPVFAGPYPFVVPANQGTKLQNQQQEIVPMDLHHPILREFPEHRETIRTLKGSNAHFRSVFDEYHRLDDEVYRIEEEIDFATDQEIEELKMRRAKLKDYIYHVIRHAPPACPVCEGTGLAR